MAKPQKKAVIHLSAETTVSRPATTLEFDSSSIAALAHRLWEARGCPEGSSEIDWFQAEQELLSQSANPMSALTEPPL